MIKNIKLTDFFLINHSWITQIMMKLLATLRYSAIDLYIYT